MKTGLVGVAYAARSKDLSNQRCINLYVESMEAKGGHEPAALYGCPGLQLVATIGNGPIRNMLNVEGVLHIVSGNQWYSCDKFFNPTLLGALATAAGPVSMVNNPTQVGVFDNLNGYAFAGGAFSTIVLPFSNPGTAVYQDGFVLVNQVGSFVVWQSNLNDLTNWSALNFSSEDGSPENIIGLAEFRRQIAVLKEQHTAFWINAGNLGFVFQRLDGIYPLRGCIAPASIDTVDDSLLWLGQGDEGQGVVYLCKGYEAQRISTYAIELAIQGYTTISDAIGFGYQQEGHFFYVLTFPTGNATWVLDLTETEKLKAPVWHQRAYFSGGTFSRFLGNCQAPFNGQVLVGDYTNGNIYALNLDLQTDNGQPRKWLRSWNAMPQSGYPTERGDFLDVELETGIQVPPNANPQLVLRQSFDGGYTWSPEIFRSAGQTGQTAQDVRFNRLGATRRGLNSIRLFELSSTDPFKVCLLGAELG